MGSSISGTRPRSLDTGRAASSRSLRQRLRTHVSMAYSRLQHSPGIGNIVPVVGKLREIIWRSMNIKESTHIKKTLDLALLVAVKLGICSFICLCFAIYIYIDSTIYCIMLKCNIILCRQYIYIYNISTLMMYPSIHIFDMMVCNPFSKGLWILSRLPQ